MDANDATMIEANTMYLTDLFQKLTSSCMDKCIAPAYQEESLGKGEANCIDRCVNKYMEVHKIVEEKMVEQQQASAAQQQQAMGQ
eukprot:m.172303 g.172303  ORF g.172303 m.172303 type:complete len:85 (+) comp24276_c1_seq1:78-332(+)